MISMNSTIQPNIQSYIPNEAIVDSIIERMPHATCRMLNVWYGKKHVLHDINMNIARNSVTAFIGPSGCGKSSLLRCFNRMNDETENCTINGNLEIDGSDIYTSKTDTVLLRTKVGMVFQKPNPFPKSIYNNIAYGVKLHYNPSKIRLNKIVEKSLVKVGLWDEVKDVLHESALNLSGGQQQRLCIARAIAIKPTILLMDEPCSALDPLATKVIERLILELKHNYTIILITHSMRQAQEIADYTAFFDSGRLEEYGETYDIFNKNNNIKLNKYIEHECISTNNQK